MQDFFLFNKMECRELRNCDFYGRENSAKKEKDRAKLLSPGLLFIVIYFN